MEGTAFCSNCGAPSTPLTGICSQCGKMVTVGGIGTSAKPKKNVLMLTIFLGWCGVHRMYIGKVASGIGILALLVIGLFMLTSEVTGNFIIYFMVAVAVWWFIDIYLVAAGKMSDKDKRPIK